MIKAGHNIMLNRYYVKSTGVQDARDLLQPDPRRHVSLITCNAATPNHTDPEPMACTGHTEPRAHGLHRRRDTLATRSPIESGSIDPKAWGPGRVAGGSMGTRFPGARGKFSVSKNIACSAAVLFSCDGAPFFLTQKRGKQKGE